MTLDRELWAIALWVEKNHGTDGPNHIAQQVTRLAEAGNFAGAAMWREVAATRLFLAASL